MSIAVQQPPTPLVGGPLPLGLFQTSKTANMSNFAPDGAGNYGAFLVSIPIGSLKTAMSFSADLGLHGSFDGAAAATRLAFQVNLRDATIMPAVTLAEAIAATAFGSIGPVVASTTVGGPGDAYASKSTSFAFFFINSAPTYGSDSYGNQFAANDALVLDLFVYVNKAGAKGTCNCDSLFNAIFAG